MSERVFYVVIYLELTFENLFHLLLLSARFKYGKWKKT